jgi:hypothetical protein
MLIQVLLLMLKLDINFVELPILSPSYREFVVSMPSSHGTGFGISKKNSSNPTVNTGMLLKVIYI